MAKNKIFVSYSHENQDWVSEVGKYKIIPWLERQLDGEAEIWTDHALKKLIGEEYTKLISNRILTSDIVILLISQDFVSSQYIMEVELPLIKQQYKNEQIKIIPLLLTDLTKKGKEKISWIFDLQTYPNDSKPLIDFVNNDARWSKIKVEILEGIENKIESLNRKDDDSLEEITSYHETDIQNDLNDSGIQNSILNETQVHEFLEDFSDYCENKLNINESFLLPIEDTFSITGRGVVVTGKIESGIVHTSDNLELVGLGHIKGEIICTGVELSGKIIDIGKAGEDVGLLLKGIDFTDIKRGMVLSKPGYITLHKQIKGTIYILEKEEGGENISKKNHDYVHFYFWTIEIGGEITLPFGINLIKTGELMKVTIQLEISIACKVGMYILIRKNQKTIGLLKITQLLD